MPICPTRNGEWTITNATFKESEIYNVQKVPFWALLKIISCAFFLKELFVRANRKCIFTGNYVTRGKIDSFK